MYMLTTLGPKYGDFIKRTVIMHAAPTILGPNVVGQRAYPALESDVRTR